jgi:hypothetical protein
VALGAATLALLVAGVLGRWDAEVARAPAADIAPPTAPIRASDVALPSAPLEQPSAAIAADRRTDVEPALAAARPERDQVQVEVATFVPLVPMSDTEMVGTVQVVRVQLPGYALGAFGVPVDRSVEEWIQADVLVGEDGLARAIRFIQ